MKRCIKIAIGVFASAIIIMLVGIQYLLSQPAPAGFPILEYHIVQEKNPDRAYEYNVPPADFEQQLDYLQQEGYTTISIRDFLRAKKGLQELPEKPIILTFDDGYESNYTELLPILEKRGLKATIFMVTNDIGRERYMSWDQLKDIQHRGVEIGSHTANHLPLTEMSLSEARDEVKLSKLLMEWNGMDTIYTFSYPNGKYSEELLKVLKEEEYLAAVTGDAGLNTFETNPYLLQRINIPHPTFGLTEFKWRLIKGRLMAQLGIWQH
ncbi:polysaccharide deacetylase family protein [uncultured Anaerovibrio sp.]|uniref:polysaccharide deacetylase family protein n=1 Tax=uncultured Anaerovibrio sp. TaxID=361586 RepID=UPI002603CC53|nr:polysaccharide deacetylase family protein [uncultured Anaerovibrio sp.]